MKCLAQKIHIYFLAHRHFIAIDCANFTLKFDSLDSLGRLSIIRSAAPANAFIHIFFERNDITNHQPTAHRGPRDPLLARVVAPAVHEKYE